MSRKHSLESVESPWKSCGQIFGSLSYGWRSVHVAQHGMEGAGEVVGVMAAVVLLSHGHHAGEADEEQEEELDEKSSPEHAEQEGRGLRGG